MNMEDLKQWLDSLDERISRLEGGNCLMGRQHDERIKEIERKVDSIRQAQWTGVGIVIAFQFIMPFLIPIIISLVKKI